MVKNSKVYLLFFATIMTTAFGDAMVMKANVGINAYETISMTLNYATHIKLGTAGLICNVICMIIYMIHTRKINFTVLMQVPMCLVAGMTVNFVYYVLFSSMQLIYPMRLIMAIVGLIISASSCGLIMNLDVGAYPYESLCQVLSDQHHIPYARVHMTFDILAVVITTLISFFFHYDFAVREASVISMLIFGPVMGFSMKKTKGLVVWAKQTALVAKTH